MPFPVVCKNRKERIAAIGDAVAKSDYHIVALQEVGLVPLQNKTHVNIYRIYIDFRAKKRKKK